VPVACGLRRPRLAILAARIGPRRRLAFACVYAAFDRSSGPGTPPGIARGRSGHESCPQGRVARRIGIGATASCMPREASRRVGTAVIDTAATAMDLGAPVWPRPGPRRPGFPPGVSICRAGRRYGGVPVLFHWRQWKPWQRTRRHLSDGDVGAALPCHPRRSRRVNMRIRPRLSATFQRLTCHPPASVPLSWLCSGHLSGRPRVSPMGVRGRARWRPEIPEDDRLDASLLDHLADAVGAARPQVVDVNITGASPERASHQASQAEICGEFGIRPWQPEPGVRDPGYQVPAHEDHRCPLPVAASDEIHSPSLPDSGVPIDHAEGAVKSPARLLQRRPRR
jgi:hypothetical protein